MPKYKNNGNNKVKRPDYCYACSKRSYTKKVAARVAARMRKARKSVHSYKCPNGNGYHVGHPNTQKDWDKVRSMLDRQARRVIE